eukprot:615475_1
MVDVKETRTISSHSNHVRNDVDTMVIIRLQHQTLTMIVVYHQKLVRAKPYFNAFIITQTKANVKCFFMEDVVEMETTSNPKKDCKRQCAVDVESTNVPITTQDSDICSLPSETGLCKAAFPRFYYNSETERCESFTWGGCGGNANNFVTLPECIVACDVFDWGGALTELNARKTLWEANGILQYRYHFQKSCFCMQCDVAGKYIDVDEGIVTAVEFDNDAPSGCDADDIRDPIEDNYMDIGGLFDLAITHVTYGMNANCDDPNELDAICGGGIDIEYDEVLNYPTFMSLEYGPMIADAGGSYVMKCLTVIDILDDLLETYDNECEDEFTAGSVAKVSTANVCSTQIGDACESGGSNGQCCDGICSTSALDNSVWICCYTERHTNVLCENDGVCCDGFQC